MVIRNDFSIQGLRLGRKAEALLPSANALAGYPQYQDTC